ncbi:MAG: nucleoid-associated protein [Anaerovoracaceae bacterium]
MKLNIEKAILHALDPASGAPVLSEEPMALDEEVREFLEAHFLKCLESDEVQTARLREESGFGQRMRALGRAAGTPAAAWDETVGAAPWEDSAAGDNGGHAGDMNGAFVAESRHLAEQIFQILSGNPEVPAGDLICMLCRTGSETGANAGKTYFAGLKMNYHDGFSHYYMNGSLTIVGQRALLPGTGRKLEEAFLVDLETLDVRILERKYLMMDESREAYLSARILGCTPEISEKSKLMAVKKAMQKANKEVLGDRKVVEQELMSRMHGYLEEEEAPVISEMCREVLRDYPQVTAMVEEQLAAENIDPEATVQVGEKTMKRFEKQSVKTPDGIEVKIPADLFADQRAMEFIQNPDGTISLLIKNVLL